MDGYSIEVCSAMCLKEAQGNWQYKKDHNIKPGAPIIEEDIEEMEGDNI